MPGPGDTVMHAEMQIGDSRGHAGRRVSRDGRHGARRRSAVLRGEHAALRPRRRRGLRACCRLRAAPSQMPPTDMFWGDRYAKLEDPFGHQWGIATHKEDVAPDEMARRMAAM